MSMGGRLVCPSTGKISWVTFARAKKMAQRLQAPGDHLQVYRCGECGCWHLGHKHGRERLS